MTFYLIRVKSFSIIFPLHLAALTWWTQVPAKAYIAGLKDAIQERLTPETMPSVERRTDFPVVRFIRIILLLTAGITCPGLLWYVAVSLTSCVILSPSALDRVLQAY